MQFFFTPKEILKKIAHNKALYIIWINLLVFAYFLLKTDLMAIDGPGRLASAKDLFTVGLHGYNDHFFFGSIQNLLYPPLQDFTLGLLLFLTPLAPPLIILKIFALCVFSFYLWSLFKLGELLKSTNSKLFFVALITSSLIIDLYKPITSTAANGLLFDMGDIFYFQGLTMGDLLSLGLINQFIGAAFWILSLRDYAKGNTTRQKWWLSLAVLSHIVFGMVAIGCFLILMTLDRKIKAATTILFQVFFLSCFYLIPFVIEREALVVASILPPKILPWLVCSMILVLLTKIGSFSYKVLTCSLAILGSVGLVVWLNGKVPWLPAFHYHRLIFPSLLLMIIAVAFTLDKWRFDKVRSLASLIILSFFWFSTFSHRFWPGEAFPLKGDLKINKLPQASSFNKALIIDGLRPVNSNLEAYLSVKSERYIFAKGLYWESAQSNLELSKFVIELFGPPSILSEEFTKTIKSKNCHVYGCMVRGLANITASSNIWLPTIQSLYEYSLDKFPNYNQVLTCMDEITSSWSPLNGSLESGPIQLTPFHNPQASLVKSGDHPPSIHTPPFEQILERCEQNPGQMINWPIGWNTNTFVRHKSGEYNLEKNHPYFFVSLEKTSGISVIDSKGESVDIHKTTMGFWGRSDDNKLIVKYSRPLLYWICYLISIISFLYYSRMDIKS